MSKYFHLGDILSITTGKVLSPRLIDGIYDILDYMTGEKLYTHQLGRASKVCRPYLLKQYPELNNINRLEITTENWKECLVKYIAIYGKELEIEPLPDGAYKYIDPISELQMIKPDADIIVVAKD